MKKISTYILLGITIFTMHSCTKKENEKSSVLLPNKRYATMSSIEKKEFQNLLILKLQNDTFFHKFNSSINLIMRAKLQERQRTGTIKPVSVDDWKNALKNGHTSSDSVAKARQSIIESIFWLYRSIPELKELDRSTRKIVFEKASKLEAGLNPLQMKKNTGNNN